MLNIYLLRHGETEWNADNNRYCGRTDIGLTQKGIAQAKQVREQLKDITFSAAFSSPLRRAYNTAKIAVDIPVNTDSRLIEVDFGEWEGKTKEEFIAENERLWAEWSHDPANNRAGGSGETATEVVQRVDDFFKNLQRNFKQGNILVVAHNGVNRLYLAFKLGMPLKNYRQLVQQNSSITRLGLDENQTLSLELLNAKLK